MSYDCDHCVLVGKCTRHPQVEKTGLLLSICKGAGDCKVRDRWIKKWDQECGVTTFDGPQPLRGVGDVLAASIKFMTMGAVQPCGGCNQRKDWLNKVLPFPQKQQKAMKPLNWQYGVTTVRMRLLDGLLEKTLASLAEAGFDRPRLFIDGDATGFDRLPHQKTIRDPAIRTFANWYLTLTELYLRDPNADRYAIFQDDFVTYKNLKTYLESIPYPEKGYLNLYTFPHNQPDQLAVRRQDGQLTHPDLNPNTKGFYRACQNGMGAVALVFNNDAVRFLLTREHLINRVKDPMRGHKAVDGGVVEAFRKEGWTEYVHNPSLVQHIGLNSSMGNNQHKQSVSFRGIGFDAMDLLSEQ